MTFSLIQQLALIIYYCGSSSTISENERKKSPSYIASLKNYDIDELLEEERVFRDEFYTYNMELKITKRIE
jgi:hypothetical protein